MSLTLRILAGIVLLASVAVIFGYTERPPIHTVQLGYRGTGLELLYNPRMLQAKYAENALPEEQPAIPASGQKASEVYQNLKVLGDVDSSEFLRLMASITAWVSPQQGCNYCHNPENLASDDIYTKVVSRRMIQMVQHINVDWKQHVAETGVTCWSCHRGNPVPANVWFNNPGTQRFTGLAQAESGQNHPTPVAGDTSLPFDPYTPFYEGDANIRVVSRDALPAGHRESIKQTEWTYALMMSMSGALGVNCEFCHNTRQFSDWSQSTPQRVTAWYGIRMVRDLNNAYLNPLRTTFPPQRLGPMGDTAKVNCTTCHQGVYKPLFGASLAKGYPELGGAPATP